MKRLAQGAALLAIAVATVAALRWTVVLPLVCEGRATRAIQMLNADEDSEAAARQAESSLRACECLERTDFKIGFARGNALHTLGDNDGAIREFRVALAVDRRPELYLALGLAQLDALDGAGAIDSFVAAGTFAPARLDEIPYNDVRSETKRRIRETHGQKWVHDAPTF
jgi:hypothetical protein